MNDTRQFLALWEQFNDEARMGARPARMPKLLPLSKITREPLLFQQRRIKAWQSDNHVATLRKALSNKGTPLEPVEVFWTGTRFVLIDGHHRMSAYEEVDWKKPVPVTVFQGTLEGAVVASLGANTQDKMPMSRVEKSDAAWRFVCADIGGSIKQLAALSGVSRRTVATMRSTFGRLAEAGEKNPMGLTWGEARHMHQEVDRGEYDGEIHVMRLTERLTKAFPAGDLLANPEVLGEALRRYDPGAWASFCDYHGVASDEPEEEEEEGDY